MVNGFFGVLEEGMAIRFGGLGLFLQCLESLL